MRSHFLMNQNPKTRTMVGVFRRSISFPNKSPAKPAITHHVRSISLPCRSHPSISQLSDQISNLKSWSLTADSKTAAWFCDGLNRLRALHNHLDDVLNLPQTQQSLRHHPLWTHNLLEHFLRFLDSYGIVHTLLLSFREDNSAAQIAIRANDEHRIAIYVKSRKRFARHMAKLASTVQRRVGTAEHGGAAADLAAVIEDAVGVTAAVSLALFEGIAESFSKRKGLAWRSGLEEKGIRELREIGTHNLRELKKKGKEETKMVMKKMRDLEDWISDIETRSHKVFRSLITARVSLLNALSHQQISQK